MSLKVEDVMVKDVRVIDENSSVRQAAKMMNKFGIGCLIVDRRGSPRGIVTERDLLQRIVAEARSVDRTKVNEIMSTPLKTVRPELEVEDAVKLMFQANIKKLPVVSHRNRLIGVVTLTDVARLQPYLLKVLKQLNSRTHLLTDTEKEMITKYLDAGKKLAGFKVTLHRCRHMQTVQNDLELISEFLARVKTEKKPRTSRKLLTGLR